MCPSSRKGAGHLHRPPPVKPHLRLPAAVARGEEADRASSYGRRHLGARQRRRSRVQPSDQVSGLLLILERTGVGLQSPVAGSGSRGWPSSRVAIGGTKHSIWALISPQAWQAWPEGPSQFAGGRPCQPLAAPDDPFTATLCTRRRKFRPDHTPQQRRNVAQPSSRSTSGLCAHQGFVDRAGVAKASRILPR